jgi:hypothetical protein
MFQRLCVVAGIGLVIGGGVVHGVWTNRWTTAAAVADATRRLGEVPGRIRDGRFTWAGQDLDVDVRTRQLAGGAGYLSRRYVNTRTGEAVTVFLVCGRPGPVAVHTPDVCYQGAGFEVVGDPAAREVEWGEPKTTAEFNRIEVKTEVGQVPVRQEVLWSWSARGVWQTPRNPRVAFARYPVLYKLYVTRTLGGEKEAAGAADAAGFVRLLLPELQKTLFNAD